MVRLYICIIIYHKSDKVKIILSFYIHFMFIKLGYTDKMLINLDFTPLPKLLFP